MKAQLKLNELAEAFAEDNKKAIDALEQVGITFDLEEPDTRDLSDFSVYDEGIYCRYFDTYFSSVEDMAEQLSYAGSDKIAEYLDAAIRGYLDKEDRPYLENRDNDQQYLIDWQEREELNNFLDNFNDYITARQEVEDNTSNLVEGVIDNIKGNYNSHSPERDAMTEIEAYYSVYDNDDSVLFDRSPDELDRDEIEAVQEAINERYAD